MDRRNALKSMIALAVAPAIVKVDMLMPVKPIVIPSYAAHTVGSYTFGGYRDITIEYPEDGDWGIVVNCNSATTSEVEKYLRKIYFGSSI